MRPHRNPMTMSMYCNTSQGGWQEDCMDPMGLNAEGEPPPPLPPRSIPPNSGYERHSAYFGASIPSSDMRIPSSHHPFGVNLNQFGQGLNNSMGHVTNIDPDNVSE